MAGIKDAMKSILDKMATLTVSNGDGNAVSPYVRVWNNQLQYDIDGKQESFPKPAFFLEVITPAVYEVIGEGVRAADISFRIHIIHEYYDATDGTYAQDLAVFDLRDRMLYLLSHFIPTGCGPMFCASEEQDFDHNNLYHYIMDFVTHFIDSRASKLDPVNNATTEKAPPFELKIDVQKEAQANASLSNPQFKFVIPQTHGNQ